MLLKICKKCPSLWCFITSTIRPQRGHREFATSDKYCQEDKHRNSKSFVEHENKILQALNNLPIDDLKEFKNFGINRARRIDAYRKQSNGFKSINELELIDGFSSSVINAILRNGLAKRSKRHHRNILTDLEAKDIGSITAITVGSHEIFWCKVSRQLNVVDWKFEEWRREKRYASKDFITKMESVLERMPVCDLRVVESQTYKSASRDPFVFPYVLHSRLTELALHSLSKVRTVTFDPNVVRKHFGLSKGFKKQYYSVPLVDDLLKERKGRMKKLSVDEIEENIDTINSFPGSQETTQLLLERDGVKESHHQLEHLIVPEHAMDSYMKRHNKEGMSNSLLLALTFLETEIVSRTN